MLTEASKPILDITHAQRELAGLGLWVEKKFAYRFVCQNDFFCA